MNMFQDMDTDILERARQIKLAVFDVDGVLTDGRLLINKDGSEHKAFHSRDGLGLIMLRDSGCHIGVISGHTSDAVSKRMLELGIEHVYQGQQNKRETLITLLDKLNIEAMATAYVGDDLIDLPAMRYVGFAIAVADAHPVVIEQAHWVSKHCGGNAAAREVCELIMHAQGILDSKIQMFLNN